MCKHCGAELQKRRVENGTGLKVKYTEEVAPALFKKFGYKSTMQIPKIDKVVVNVAAAEGS